jgi:hypothetical protein
MLEYSATHEASRQFRGGLGAIAHAVLAGLEAAGTPAASVNDMRLLMDNMFPLLSDQDCDVLCEVVYNRLLEERGPDGHWYP